MLGYIVENKEGNEKMVKVEFKGKLFILGCGSVAQCFIPILMKLLDIPPRNITVMDSVDNSKKIAPALQQGVSYVQKKLTRENYPDVLKEYLSAGDLFVDLSCNVETLDMLDWCHHNGVLFVNTAVEVWDPYHDANKKSPTELTLYHRQMAIRDLIATWDEPKGPTAIVDHGANPGLVSHFTKQALTEIARKILEEKPGDNRCTEIEKALQDHHFARLAHLIGLKTIHVSERDTQITDKPKLPGEFVNTWSVDGFIEEGIAPAELGWGTHENYIPRGAMFHQKGPGNQICMKQKGIKTWVRSWVPSGEITGMVVRHGEAFSLSDYLTVREGDVAIYRPTVHYAYCPCDSAINSLHEMEMRYFVQQANQRVLSNEIISGKDELGCLLMGHDFKSWWIGTVLDIKEARELVPGQNATTVQVAIAVAAAVVYAIKHPNLGFCLPDHLDHTEILPIVKPYLGKFISTQVDWSPLDNAKAFADYNDSVPAEEDMWQFATFLISPKDCEPLQCIDDSQQKLKLPIPESTHAQR